MGRAERRGVISDFVLSPELSFVWQRPDYDSDGQRFNSTTAFNGHVHYPRCQRAEQERHD